MMAGHLYVRHIMVWIIQLRFAAKCASINCYFWRFFVAIFFVTGSLHLQVEKAPGQETNSSRQCGCSLDGKISQIKRAVVWLCGFVRLVHGLVSCSGPVCFEWPTHPPTVLEETISRSSSSGMVHFLALPHGDKGSKTIVSLTQKFVLELWMSRQREPLMRLDAGHALHCSPLSHVADRAK